MKFETRHSPQATPKCHCQSGESALRNFQRVWRLRFLEVPCPPLFFIPPQNVLLLYAEPERVSILWCRLQRFPTGSVGLEHFQTEHLRPFRR